MLVIQTYHSVEICLRFGGSFFISDPMPVSSCTRMQHFLLFILCRLYVIVILTTLIISKKPGNTGISRDIRTEFTTDLLLSD